MSGKKILPEIAEVLSKCDIPSILAQWKLDSVIRCMGCAISGEKTSPEYILAMLLLEGEPEDYARAYKAYWDARYTDGPDEICWFQEWGIKPVFTDLQVFHRSVSVGEALRLLLAAGIIPEPGCPAKKGYGYNWGILAGIKLDSIVFEDDEE